MLNDIKIQTLERIINSVRKRVSGAFDGNYALILYGSGSKIPNQNLKQGYTIGDLDFWVIGDEKEISFVKLPNGQMVSLNQLKLWALAAEISKNYGFPVQIGYSPNVNLLDTFGKTAVLYGKIIDNRGNVTEKIEKLKKNGIPFKDSDYKVTKMSLQNKLNRYFGRLILAKIDGNYSSKKVLDHLRDALDKVITLHVYGRDNGKFPKDIISEIRKIRKYGDPDITMKKLKIDRDFRTLQDIISIIEGYSRKIGEDVPIISQFYMSDVVSPSNESWRSVLAPVGGGQYLIAGFIKMNQSSEFSVLPPFNPVYSVVLSFLAKNLEESKNIKVYEVVY